VDLRPPCDTSLGGRVLTGELWELSQLGSLALRHEQRHKTYSLGEVSHVASRSCWRRTDEGASSELGLSEALTLEPRRGK
jgi:hypothetical protein